MKTLNTYLIITIGLFINAIGWTAFLIPARLSGGGISGLATLIYYGKGIPISVTVLIINIFLIIIGIRIIGRSYGTKTIFSIITLSTFLAILQNYITSPIIKEDFMSAIIGGALAGAGVGIVFTQGGSTGGTDIIASIINKYKDISIGRVIIFLDIIIIASSYLVFHSVEKIVYGYVIMSVTAYTIDILIIGSKQSVQFFIVSDHYEQIAKRVSNELVRGITILDGHGWYSKKERKVVIVMTKKYEAHRALKIIREIDPNAFISLSGVMGVYGLGFDKIKV